MYTSLFSAGVLIHSRYARRNSMQIILYHFIFNTFKTILQDPSQHSIPEPPLDGCKKSSRILLRIKGEARDQKRGWDNEMN